MTTVCLRISDAFVDETDKFAHKLHLSRAEYVRKAIILMNQKMQYFEKRQRMKKASLKTREESMCVNKEFSAIEYEPKD